VKICKVHADNHKIEFKTKSQQRFLSSAIGSLSFVRGSRRDVVIGSPAPSFHKSQQTLSLLRLSLAVQQNTSFGYNQKLKLVVNHHLIVI
jgi:hypothetical protein